LVTDFSKSKGVPRDLISRGRVIWQQQRPGMALCIVVGMRPIVANMFEVTAPLMPRLRPRMCTAKTLDEAYKIIETHAANNAAATL
ncbi:MAG: hypothetical protein AAF125_18680, partial [Chloroflexota bacterium]